MSWQLYSLQNFLQAAVDTPYAHCPFKSTQKMSNGTQKNGRNVNIAASDPDHEFTSAKEPQTLNTQAFADLSRKIQAKFSKFSNDGPKDNSKQPKRHDSSARKTTDAKPILESTPSRSHSKGKKRDIQGVVKEQDTSKVPSRPIKADSTAKKILEKEAYSLGGTAEDLALIASLDSESELDNEGKSEKALGGTKFEKGLKKGIADILKQIDEYGRSNLMESDIDGEDDAEDENDDKVDDVSLPPTAARGNIAAPKSRPGSSKLLIAPCSDWFNIQLPPIKSTNISTSKVSPNNVQQLYEHAISLLYEENDAFKASQQSSSSQNFYSTVIASGTLSDKISALTLAVQESPLHNVKALETLVNLAKKRSRTQAVDVLRALKDLFAQGSLLPSDRKLSAFATHPGVIAALGNSKSWKPGNALPGSLQPQHVIVWAYESWLKEKYFEVLKTLEIWCNDEIEFSKSKAVSFVYELLKEKPEQESNLLRLLINKLGDPGKKIASQTSYLVMQLMAAHPLMKMTIISSIDSDLLFRPGQSLHAKYYAVITLNQTALSGKEEDIASKLLSIYFSLFVGLLKPGNEVSNNFKGKSGANPVEENRRKPMGKHNDSENGQAEELREKLTSAILTGINRAYPYTESSSQRFVCTVSPEQGPSLY
jgi:ribosome biogenesis protein MAK21